LLLGLAHEVLRPAARDLCEHVPRPRGLHLHRPLRWRRRARDPDLRGAPEVRRLVLGLLLVVLAAPAARAADPEPTTPIKHFGVLMQENHTFDNYFSNSPGADGPPKNVCMPKVVGDPSSGCVNRVWIGNTPTLDLLHSTEVSAEQLNGGKMAG